MNNDKPNKIRIGNRSKTTTKQRFSKNDMLRVQNGASIGSTKFNDMKPKWILELYAEFGITYYPRANPIDELQERMARKHNAIEKQCRLFAEAKHDEERKRRRGGRNNRNRNRNGGERNGVLRKG